MRLFERDMNMALSGQVVNFVRFQIQYQVGKVLPVGQITVVKKQLRICLASIGANVFDSLIVL